VNRADFQDLADLRISEADCLFRNGMFDGAYYLAGYAVEAGLKACIAKMTNQYDFPPKHTNRDCYSHDLELLLRTAELDTILAIDRKANRLLNDNWDIVKVWKEESRYDSRGSKSHADADQLLQAITNIPDGILTWVKQRW
jgi:HEPN domain-containing protein